jgi:uncharacterized protein (TIGR04255 family)
MIEEPFHIENPPIVEAVIDIDCDLPPTFDLRAAQQTICETFKDSYPQTREQVLSETQMRQERDAPPQVQMGRQALHAVQLIQEDGKQLVQFRENGFSFNRLAPYNGLDVYLGEIERTWNLFQKLANPVKIRKVALRTINRILLPVEENGINLEEYIKTSPRLPTNCDLIFVGFLNHHKAVDPHSENQVDIILTAQPVKTNELPIILDINAFREVSLDYGDWAEILSLMGALRDLKNNVFRNTLTEKCLNLF